MLEAVDGHCPRRRTRHRVSAVEYPGEPHSRRSPRRARPARPPPSGGSNVTESTSADYEGLKESSHRPIATAVKMSTMEKDLQLCMCWLLRYIIF